MSFLKNIAVFAGLFVCLSVAAQPDRRDVRKGNRDFRKENYRAAEIDYRKALVKDSTSFAANYNLAGTLYRNGDMEQARRYLDTLRTQAAVSGYASDYYYNSGNVAVEMKDWQAAVDSYMQSLLRNPGDLDAKENFIYAQKMLQNQQNGGGQDNQDDKDNQDNKDNKDNQDKQDNQDNGNEQDNGGDKNQDNQGSPDNQDRNGQQDQPKISPQAAQQMLQAIQAKEKETQEKVNKEKANAMKTRQKEKNW